MKPLVSVIIPMHNAAATIARTIRSLRDQTEHRWHAHIIDDGCTDSAATLIRRCDDPRISLAYQPRAGAGAARNKGLDLAQGEYIAFLDADDWLEPTAFEELLRAARETGAARGRCRMVSPEGVPIGWEDAPAPPGTIGLDDLLRDEGFAIHSQLIRRDLMGDLRFRTDLAAFEDSDFFLHLASQGVRWTRSNALVCAYRLRPRDRGTGDFADRISIILDVIGGHESRANSGANTPSTLPTRALNYAMLTLLQDASPDKDLAASILSRIPSPSFDAATLARTALAYLPLSEESGPASWQTRLDAYVPHLRSWWTRCIRENWTTPDATEAALSLLAHLIANALDIPARLIDTLTPGSSVVLLGLGANGVRLAHALSDRAIPFEIRDDAVTEDELKARLPGLSAPLAPATPDTSAHYLMSVLDDRAFLSKLPTNLRLSRWSDAVDALSRSILERLQPLAASPHNAAPATITRPMPTPKRPVDLFLGSFKRPEKLAAMIESVRETGYPARILVSAGDLATVELCERYPGLVECVYNTEANTRIGCTAPLNHVYKSLVRRDALFCTDDCIFAKDALDIAMTTLYERFADGDGVVGLKQENIPDGYDLAFPLMGRRFLDRFSPAGSGRDIFFPGYFHLFNDAEIGLTIKCLGNWVFEPRATLRHFHPAHGGTLDSTHSHGLTHHQADGALWCERRAKGLIWGIDEVAEDKSQLAHCK